MQMPIGMAPMPRPRAAPGGRSFWQRKKFTIAAGVFAAALAYLIFVSTQSFGMYHLTVGEVLARQETAVGERLRLGGTAVPGSVQQVPGTMTLRFEVTDGQRRIPVSYTGVVPDSFKPDADVVVEGVLTPRGIFEADVLLAKCPSKYVPA